MNRRAFIRRGALGGFTLGIAKALHNTTIGYGQFGIGDNLQTADIEQVAKADMPALEWRERTIGDQPVRLTPSGIRYQRDGRWPRIDEDAPPIVHEFQRDLTAIHADEFTFAFSGIDSFFDTVETADVRPAMVTFLRNSMTADPSLVETVTGVSPTRPQPLLTAFVELFRDRSRYDVPRYVAGSIDDNVLPFDANLRDPFEPDIDFELLASHDDTIGMFCTEYTWLVIEALHSVPAERQTPPVFGVQVRNRRHKHMYNGIGSVIRRDDELIIPMTFADYTDTTLIDDFRAGRFVDDSLDAYDTSHRADQIRW